MTRNSRPYTDPGLLDLIARSKRAVEAMTPAEVDVMVRQQIEGIARVEAIRSKPRYHWENGVKVYESYEDYCND